MFDNHHDCCCLGQCIRWNANNQAIIEMKSVFLLIRMSSRSIAEIPSFHFNKKSSSKSRFDLFKVKQKWFPLRQCDHAHWCALPSVLECSYDNQLLFTFVCFILPFNKATSVALSLLLLLLLLVQLQQAYYGDWEERRMPRRLA